MAVVDSVSIFSVVVISFFVTGFSVVLDDSTLGLNEVCLVLVNHMFLYLKNLKNGQGLVENNTDLRLEMS